MRRPAWPSSLGSGAGSSGPNSAAEVLAQAIRATSNLTSVHLQARIRTIPHDNFEMIGLTYDFVDHDLWKKFELPPQWRVEKSVCVRQ